ncbi:MAG: hypothetical protein AAFQ68_27510 [Bacteroidota bacterium]
MDIIKELEQLEDKFYGEWEEDKSQLIAAMTEMHNKLMQQPDEFNRFLVQSSDRFGGAYIPHLFWEKLASFVGPNPDDRFYIQQLLRSFVSSNFDEEEQKIMKPLIITYLAKEKPFEISKVKAQIIEPSHPAVKEYFQKLVNFTEKNQKSTEMYCEKFLMLQDYAPNFALLGLPITQLREQVK